MGNVEYPIHVLRQDREAILEHLSSNECDAKTQTRLKHRLYGLEFAIEVLQTYLDETE